MQGSWPGVHDCQAEEIGDWQRAKSGQALALLFHSGTEQVGANFGRVKSAVQQTMRCACFPFANREITMFVSARGIAKGRSAAPVDCELVPASNVCRCEREGTRCEIPVLLLGYPAPIPQSIALGGSHIPNHHDPRSILCAGCACVWER